MTDSIRIDRPRRHGRRRGAALMLVLAALGGAAACRTPEPNEPAGEPSSSGGAPGAATTGEAAGAGRAELAASAEPSTSPSTSTPRPALRRLFTANPETVQRQVPEDNLARIRAYLAAHSGVPAEISAAISAGELWQGMTEAEVELSVGPATGRETNPAAPNGFALVYAGEGWVLGFDDQRFLASIAERKVEPKPAPAPSARPDAAKQPAPARKP